MIYSNSMESEREFVRRGEIPALLHDPFVITAWNEWRRYRRFGLPHGSGPQNEGRRYITAIEICEQEHDLWSSKELEKNR